MKRVVLIILTLLLAACGGGSPTLTPPVTNEPGVAPSIGSFTASPPTITAPGDPTTLNWQIAGGYDTLQLTDSTSTNVLNVNGSSFTVRPIATTTYRLTATSPSGSASSETTVVLQGTDPTPQPTPTPPTPTPDPPSNPPPAKPTINSFRASPLTVQLGDSAALEWNVSGATSLKIDKGVGTVTGTSVTVTPSQTTTYTLTATNAGGNTTAKAKITVASEPSTPDVPYYGRWLVTFNGGTDETTFVFEADITDAYRNSYTNGGRGKYLFCHQRLRGTLCSTFSTANGAAFLGAYDTGDEAYQVGLTLHSGFDIQNDLATLDAGDLRASSDSTNGKKLEGQATYYADDGTTYEGTVTVENVGSPRQLK